MCQQILRPTPVPGDPYFLISIPSIPSVTPTEYIYEFKDYVPLTSSANNPVFKVWLAGGRLAYDDLLSNLNLSLV